MTTPAEYRALADRVYDTLDDDLFTACGPREITEKVVTAVYPAIRAEVLREAAGVAIKQAGDDRLVADEIDRQGSGVSSSRRRTRATAADDVAVAILALAQDQSRPECCPVCGGDCGSATPPVDPMSCPMRRNDPC